MLEGLFATGRIVDLILVLVIIEGALLIAVRAKTGRGPSPSQTAANLAAGASLMLAVRSALVAAHWSETALWLLVGLLAHLVDLAVRWR